MSLFARKLGPKGLNSREVDLDIVRGVAILLAMGWHVNHIDTGTTIGSLLLAPAARIGWAGVDLFFVLSGFLIGGMILREYRNTGTFAYRTFLFRRVFRLWPTLYVFLFAMLLLGGVGWQDFFWQAALHVQNYVYTKSATHLWSLAVEEHFYVILGVLMPMAARRLPVERWLPHSLLAVLLICPLLRLAAVYVGQDPVAIQTATHFRLDALGSGVLLSYVAWRMPEFFKKLLARRMLWAASLTLALVFLWNTRKDTGLGQVAGYSVAWLAAIAFILLVYRSGIEHHARPFCLGLAFLGQVSYPLYLWHVPVARIAERLAPRILGNEHPGLAVLIVYTTSISVAYLVSVGVEHPFMRLRDALIPARVAPHSPATAETVRSV